jgi:glutathione synthase/RimK-type ligase-like ATP-grasp enzyme
MTGSGVGEGMAQSELPLEEPLPRVVVVYGAAQFNPMVLAEAASRVPCRLIWVVDESNVLMAPLVRLLRRLGDVVDSAGLDAHAIAEELVPLGPGGITTFSEECMALTAALARDLSFVFHSPSTAERLADKYEQRLALRLAGVPGPAVWEVPAHSSEVPVPEAQLSFPVVVKPRRGTGSLATARADDVHELSDLLARFTDIEGGLLVEDFLPDRDSGGPFADDLAVELLLQAGHVFRLATTGKFKHAPPFRGRGCFLPSHLDPSTEADVFEAAEAAVRALGITDGFVNVDVKLTPEGPRVVEVNGRLGGNVQLLMELAGGPAIMPWVFRFALGEDMSAEPALTRILDRRWQKVGYFAWVQSPMSATRLSGVEGIEDVSALPHVSSVVRNQRQGEPIDWTTGGRFNVCEVFGSVEDYEVLAFARGEIDELIDLEFDEATGIEAT